MPRTQPFRNQEIQETRKQEAGVFTGAEECSLESTSAEEGIQLVPPVTPCHPECPWVLER